MFTGIGPAELAVVLLVALLLFGSKQLPQVARSLGKGLRDFQRATQSAKDEIHKILEEEDTPPRPKRDVLKKTHTEDETETN